jgi:hypothetical protein
MDGSRFDDLTRFMAETPSRRTVVKTLVGAVAGSLLGLRGESARADNLCKPSGSKPQSKCTKNAQCCSGACCGGQCTDLGTMANCGACGITCTTAPAHGTPICAQGTCSFTCAAGFTKCGNACVDTTTDVYHCGGCGTVCPVNEHCEPGPGGAGHCVCGTLTDATTGEALSCYDQHPDWPQPGTYCCPYSKPAGGGSECLRGCNFPNDQLDAMSLGPGDVPFDCGGTPTCPDGSVMCVTPYDPTVVCPSNAVCCYTATATCDTTTGACVRL